VTLFYRIPRSSFLLLLHHQTVPSILPIMAGNSRVALAFQQAKIDFEKDLDDPKLLSQINQTTSMKQVYDVAQRIQEEQGKTGSLRHLRKIEPYLQRLRQFQSVIDAFVHVKPDMLALIWGPIKLLLVLTSTLSQSFDAIREIMCDIGDRLPFFEAYTALFATNDRVLDVLCLFYKDILEFHCTALKFFRSKRKPEYIHAHILICRRLIRWIGWTYIFESVWPRHKARIDIVGKNIEQHTLMMSNEVQLEHIRESYRARAEALDKWERDREFQERQDFNTVEVSLSAYRYEPELYRLLNVVTRGTGSWLSRNKDFTQWLDAADDSKRFLWLQGIPGAGKNTSS
jgi:hypothetical protein